ncbi:MAG: transporter substrate-binding domain-containing protein, partial [Phaeodactylibacter sp.]|nr:transporter substrate-binding domain-containing protein [Phaeodactylibacter sp.]
MPKKQIGKGIALFLALSLFEFCQPAAHTNENEKGPAASGPDTTSLHLASSGQLDDVIGLNERWVGGLEGMIARRRIRALVPYSPTSYYINGTERSGIAYEAMSHFEQELNQKMGQKQKINIVFIPLSRDQLIPALLEGYGDIVVAGLTITPGRQKLVDFSLPVLTGAREVLVSGPGVTEVEGFETLLKYPVYVRRSSSFYEHLLAINDSLRHAGMPQTNIRLVEEQLEDEDILEMVNAGL